MTSPAALSLRDVSKRFSRDGSDDLIALDHVNAKVEVGDTIAIVGRSGSGKSTLLHLAAAIDVPTEGTVEVFGKNPSTLSEKERTLLRRSEVGLVFQFFHLLPHLSVAENVALSGWIAGEKEADLMRRVRELLDRVGLGDRHSDPADKLSGGEQQRIAICRALLRRPRLLLADEPTGNLDDQTGTAVMDLLEELVREENATLMFATHSRELAGRAKECWSIRSGSLQT